MLRDLKNRNIYKLKIEDKEIFEASIITFPYPILINDEIHPILMKTMEHLNKVYDKIDIRIEDVIRIWNPNSTYALILSDYLKYNEIDFNKDYFDKDVFYEICKVSNVKYSKIGNKLFDYDMIYNNLVRENIYYKNYNYECLGPKRRCSSQDNKIKKRRD